MLYIDKLSHWVLNYMLAFERLITNQSKTHYRPNSNLTISDSSPGSYLGNQIILKNLSSVFPFWKTPQSTSIKQVLPMGVCVRNVTSISLSLSASVGQCEMSTHCASHGPVEFVSVELCRKEMADGLAQPCDPNTSLGSSEKKWTGPSNSHLPVHIQKWLHVTYLRLLPQGSSSPPFLSFPEGNQAEKNSRPQILTSPKL